MIIQVFIVSFFVIIFVGSIIGILCRDISNSCIVECNKQLVGYGILNCFREDREVQEDREDPKKFHGLMFRLSSAYL